MTKPKPAKAQRKITKRQSAYLNLNTARGDIESAEIYWCQGTAWNQDCIRSIDMAMNQLLSAKLKMENL